jgi:hypothetical protein
MGTPSPALLPTVANLKKYCVSSYPGKGVAIRDDFAAGLLALQQSLNMPLWLLVQNGQDYGSLDDEAGKSFWNSKAEFTVGEKVALLVDSPGGFAKCAFQIARFLNKRCGGFVAVVPRYAKSAATLLVLGADQIILGPHAELGPLDVQLWDREREDFGSALNEVQALDRLNAFAMQAIDSAMVLWSRRSGMTMKFLLPGVQSFVAEMMRPLIEKIDTVHYTQSSRHLKVAEEYAIRLLRPKYGDKTASKIARALVHQYPEHGFFIDAEEAESIQLETDEPDAAQGAAMDLMATALETASFIGRFQEI